MKVLSSLLDYFVFKFFSIYIYIYIYSHIKMSGCQDESVSTYKKKWRQSPNFLTKIFCERQGSASATLTILTRLSCSDNFFVFPKLKIYRLKMWKTVKEIQRSTLWKQEWHFIIGFHFLVHILNCISLLSLKVAISTERA